MLTVGIILCYLLGLSIMLVISRKYSLAEVVGYSFLIGMGIETFFLFFLDLVGVKYSSGVLIGLNVFAIVALCGANYKNLLTLKDELKIPPVSLKDINLVAVFLFCIMAYLFYAITVKNLFWPPTEHDTIGSFDKLGRIMAEEGRLKISLYQYNLEGAGGLYPPLYHGSFAYVSATPGCARTWRAAPAAAPTSSAADCGFGPLRPGFRGTRHGDARRSGGAAFFDAARLSAG